MFRFLVVLIVAVCMAGGVAFYSGWLKDYVGEPGSIESNLSAAPARVKTDLGGPLYVVVKLAPLQQAQPRTSRQLVVEPCHVIVWESQEVSSQREGHVLYVGEDVTDKGPIAAGQGVVSIKFFDGEKERNLNFRPLDEGDVVEPGQVVAVVNPSMASHEVASKKVKVAAAEADYSGTKEILFETQIRKNNLERLRQAKGAVTDIEMGEASVAVAKYAAEAKTKQAGIDVAISELNQAKLILRQHFLESQLHGKGVIKKIYKHRGEGIKPQEMVMELQNISQLRVEGMVDSQYYRLLKSHKNAACYLEPSVEMGPSEQMKAHKAEVTCVAICADGEHFVSGSEDHMVYVWRRGQLAPVNTLRHKSAVRSVVCSPKGAWVIVGCADGSLTRWDLARPKEPFTFNEKDHHRGPVTALAFSPDGTYVASGGEDNAIHLWTTATGELVYPFDAEHGADDAHQGTITSLQFTPQCKLVSAARDNTLRVWDLGKNGAELDGEPINFRGGMVNQLGVSADGRFMLFDKGKTIQLLNTADGSPVTSLDNLAGLNPFDTLAMFSPDGSLMLTGGAGEGKLHLWKTPTPQDRAYQVRELVTKDRSAITSAAFAPAGRNFVVTGSKEGFVHMWQLPDKAALDSHLISRDANNQQLTVSLVEQQQEAGKTRIAVDVVNPADRLAPGQRVTLVVVLPLEGN